MKPIKTKHTNCTYAENQKGVLPLPVYRINDRNGTIVSCWKLSFKEWLHILFGGKIYVLTFTMRLKLQPYLLATKRKKLYLHPDDKEFKEFTKLKKEQDEARKTKIKQN